MVPAPAWTVDRLAARAGMTVRNVRAHAARGLLPPPRMQGRTGFYGDEHLARLELITRLQGEGFSLAAIERLVDAAPGRSAERAVTQYLEMLAPWQAEPPVEIDHDEFVAWVGAEHSEADHAALRDAGLVEDLPGERVRVHTPSMVRAGTEARRLGMPLADLLATRRLVLEHVSAVADEFTDLFRRTVWRAFLDEGMPRSEFEGVRHAVAALQPIAATTLMSAFRESMPVAIGEQVRAASLDLGGARDEPRGGDDPDGIVENP